MPTYQAQCIVGRTGKGTRRKIDATTPADARLRLRRQGMFAVTVSETHLRDRNRRVRRGVVLELFHELHLLLLSHDIIQALALLRDNFPHKPVRGMLREIHSFCATSKGSVAQAFAQYPKTFPTDIIELIAAGETAGPKGLALRFRDIAARLRFSAERRRDAVEALSYPAVLMVSVLGVLITVFIYLLPRFIPLLTSFDAKLPTLTKNLMAVSEFALRFWPYTPFLILPCIGFALLRKWHPAALLLDRAAWSLPYAGEIIRHHITADIFSNYLSLYNAGVQPPEILASCAKITSNRYVRHTLRQMHRWVALEGMTPELAFKAAKIFPAAAVMSFMTGAQSGRLPEQLDHITERCHDVARRRSQRLFTIIRYVALIVLGAVVALTVIGVLLPIRELAFKIQ